MLRLLIIVPFEFVLSWTPRVFNQPQFYRSPSNKSAIFKKKKHFSIKPPGRVEGRAKLQFWVEEIVEKWDNTFVKRGQ